MKIFAYEYDSYLPRMSDYYGKEYYRGTRENWFCRTKRKFGEKMKRISLGGQVQWDPLSNFLVQNFGPHA